MGRFVARLCAAAVLGVSLIAGQAGLASASLAASGHPASAAGISSERAASLFSAALAAARPAADEPSAMVSGFNQYAVPANDDGSTSSPVALPFPIRFYGNSYSSVYVNNNGNLTFGTPLSTYTP